MDFAQFWYVNMLFLVEFADWNGERIGRGCSTNGSKMNNGQTDAMGYHTGTTAASRDSYGFTQYRNIEGWWDNVYDWMDGCYYNNNGLNVISNPNNFSDSANGTLVGTPSSGYPSDFTIPTASGLEWALFPSAANGSQTTYVPDFWSFSGGDPVPVPWRLLWPVPESRSVLRQLQQYVVLGRLHRLSPPGTPAKGGVTVPLKR